MSKKLIGIAAAVLMLFGIIGLVGCDNTNLTDYKTVGKAAIETYAQERKDNYCEDNWTMVCGIVDAGKQAVDDATSKAGIDTAVTTAKTAINAVEEGKVISFTISDKTTDYYANGERQQLFKLIKSFDELAQLLRDENFTISPPYDIQFFEDKVLLIYFFTSNIYNDLEVIMKTNGESLDLYKLYDLPNGLVMDAERNWVFLIEIEKINTLDTKTVQIKQ
ncbi:MAG TPA: hypothetical protein PLW60_03625 [Bacilli bacterium]|nr:MAG: hypothetical protein BWY97_00889 [Tenericutes bacterium ADurb.BinA124]HPX84318.1 hypothetical protein [Bacilli bacterium]HQC74604.1 hypothetical protein [Bacilli bacterium]